MRIAAKCLGALLLLVQMASVPVGVHAGSVDDDLSFPASPEPFGYARASKMFKPQGAGPFPALVMLPTCGGHLKRHPSMSGRRLRSTADTPCWSSIP